MPLPEKLIPLSVVAYSFGGYDNERPVLHFELDSGYHLFFFFSSRRRHTRSLCDWSSDVCSSDLAVAEARPRRRRRPGAAGPPGAGERGADPADHRRVRAAGERGADVGHAGGPGVQDRKSVV